MIAFDQFIGIDWSGAKTPIQNPSIAVARCFRGNGAPQLIKQNKPWSRQNIAKLIEEIIQSEHKTLIGIDANLGYAREIMQKQMAKEATAKDLWAAVDKYNQNNPNFLQMVFGRTLISKNIFGDREYNQPIL